MTYTKNDLIGHLGALGVNPKGTLMVHLSYKAVGEVDGRGDAVLDALTEYMRQGLLVLPCHTWENVNPKNPVMDVLYTPSCVGALTELFRKRQGVVRSLHPTHSLAAAGIDAAEFLRGEEHIRTPCGKHGVYHKLSERRAQILLIGVNLTRCTFIHGIEEWHGAVGSISHKPSDYFVVGYNGLRLHTPQYRHCARLGSETFGKLEPEALRQSVMLIKRFGNAGARLIDAAALEEMTAAFIRSDPEYLLRH
ncbi:MAG: AAC(3) family N-acetyltransferase [Oscillospiraceae bacterium]|jgi:aminoglycoside 3-N-acetyltransferase|nr:AAC(3) family N-acetyltransferase [Oscillospiraceae bacterium]